MWAGSAATGRYRYRATRRRRLRSTRRLPAEQHGLVWRELRDRSARPVDRGRRRPGGWVTGPSRSGSACLRTIQLNITGKKSWHGFAPFVGGTAGVAWAEETPADTSGYRFGTRAVLAPLSDSGSPGPAHSLPGRRALALLAAQVSQLLLPGAGGRPSGAGRAFPCGSRGPSRGGVDRWRRIPFRHRVLVLT
jgi:hypothetical protein